MSLLYYLMQVRWQGGWYNGWCAWRTGLTAYACIVADIVIILALSK
jgi:hypothetical protein